MKHIDDVTIRFGKTDKAQVFNRRDWPGDTQHWEITFDPPFPDGVLPTVFLSANDQRLNRNAHNVAVVGTASHITNEGFVLSASNPECRHGEAGFNWVAIHEGFDEIAEAKTSLRLGTVHPRNFGPRCSNEVTDWGQWEPRFHLPQFQSLPLVIASPKDRTVNSNQENFLGTAYHLINYVHPVPLVRKVSQTNFELGARNAMRGSGHCAMFFAGFTHDDPQGNENIFVTGGHLEPKQFEGYDGNNTDSWVIYFDEPFVSPPVVLVTASDVATDETVGITGIIGSANFVSRFGFVLRASNTATSPREVGFSWAAFGCKCG